MRSVFMIWLWTSVLFSGCGPSTEQQSTSVETKVDSVRENVNEQDNPTTSPRLTGTNWKLVALYDRKPTPPLQGISVVNLLFEENQTIFGFSGCNTVAGRYSATENRLQLEPEITTDVICEREDEEQLFLKMLNNTTYFQIQNDTLFFLDEGNTVIGKFKSVTHLLLFH